MIRIAIVEDEKEYQEMFLEYVERYAKERALEIETDVFSDGLDLTEEYSASYQGILLDIKMKHQDGISAAHKIREHDNEVVIMFITTLAQYAIHGYEVGAIDYVLKPVEYEKFAVRFSKLIKRIEQRSNEYLLLKAENGTDKVLLKHIKYMEVNHHTLNICAEDVITQKEKKYSIRKSISAMEKELANAGFARCDQSVLVNVRAISSIKKDTVIIGDKTFPISRSKRKPFLNAVASFTI